jgi:hypothetical protein
MDDISVRRANDKYRATLRSTWIYSPADSSLLVTAIPDNYPTIVVVGWGTDLETVFTVTGVSGDSASNYALTGVAVLRGAGLTENLPENTAVNCLNNEEFFNQYETIMNELIDEVNDVSTGYFPYGVATTRVTGHDQTQFPQFGGIKDHGAVGATEVVLGTDGDRHLLTLDENVIITLGAFNQGQTVTIYMPQDGSGTNTITFGTLVVWSDGITPTWTTTAGKMNIAVITYVGSTFYGVANKFA